MFRLAKIAVFALIAGLFVTPALAETACGDHDDLRRALQAQHAEMPKSLGLAHNGAVIEVYAAPSGSWTMLLTRPDGQACVIGHGEAWQDISIKPGAKA